MLFKKSITSMLVVAYSEPYVLKLRPHPKEYQKETPDLWKKSSMEWPRRTIMTTIIHELN